MKVTKVMESLIFFFVFGICVFCPLSKIDKIQDKYFHLIEAFRSPEN